MARSTRVYVRGLERAQDRLDLLGLKAFDQRAALAEAAAAAPPNIVPRWQDQSGDLTRSLSAPDNQHVYASSYTIVSDVYYARFVFYGTKHAPKKRKPLVRRKALTADAQQRVASALVGPF